MPTYTSEAIYGALKAIWAYDEFRPQQFEIISSILKNKATIGLLPTGGGKSLCFQLPALLMPRYTLVISPLIALIKDQVNQLESRGVKAAGINYQMSKEEIKIIYEACGQGQIKLLYVSPERMRTKGFLALLKKAPPDALIVDEAHCISQWGHDFRPSYLEISKVKDLIIDLPIHAFTATADRKVLNDITHYLELNKPEICRLSYERENLAFHVHKTENKYRSLLHFVSQHKGSGIVYVRSRQRTEEIANYLLKNNKDALYYHAGIEVGKRSALQNEWMGSRDKLIVSTNAFGMGVDKADVRFVIHWDLPEDIESYYQEAGRAGRDGKDSIALLLYNTRDIKQLKERVHISFPSFQKLKLILNLLKGKSTGTYNQSLRIDFELIEKILAKGFKPTSLIKHVEILKKMAYIDFDEEMLLFGELNKNESDPEIDVYKKGGIDPNIFATVKRFYGLNKVGKYYIYEKEIADYLEIDEKLVRDNLLKLNKVKNWAYREAGGVLKLLESAMIHNSRKRKYNKHRKVKLNKMQHMIDYVQLDLCRQLYILRYFGEHSSRKCKKCDLCMGSQNNDYSHVDISHIEDILNKKGKKGLNIDELMFELPFFEQNKFSGALEELYYEGKISVKGKRIFFKHD